MSCVEKRRDVIILSIKDGAYIINLDDYSDIGTHYVVLYVQNNVIYFDSFGVEHIPKKNKNIY